MSRSEPKSQKSLEERRQRILAAARTVFASEGGLSAGLRPIAAEAGVTTGAIYAVFSNKEDIYAALLEESLTDLAAAVSTAAAREPAADKALRAAAFAFFDYYQSHRFESRLGMYLFEQDGRKGLGPERDKALNDLLGQSLRVFTACFERLGAKDDGSETSATALSNGLFAALLGTLEMATSGRDRSVKSDARDILNTLLTVKIAFLSDNSVI